MRRRICGEKFMTPTMHGHISSPVWQGFCISFRSRFLLNGVKQNDFGGEAPKTCSHRDLGKDGAKNSSFTRLDLVHEDCIRRQACFTPVRVCLAHGSTRPLGRRAATVGKGRNCWWEGAWPPTGRGTTTGMGGAVTGEAHGHRWRGSWPRGRRAAARWEGAQPAWGRGTGTDGAERGRLG